MQSGHDLEEATSSESQPRPIAAWFHRWSHGAAARNLGSAARATGRYLGVVVAFYWTQRAGLWQLLLDELRRLHDEECPSEICLSRDDDVPGASFEDGAWRIKLPACCAICGVAVKKPPVQETQAAPQLTWVLGLPLIGLALCLVASWWIGLWIVPVALSASFVGGYALRGEVTAHLTYFRCAAHAGRHDLPRLRAIRTKLIISTGDRAVRYQFRNSQPDDRPTPVEIPSIVVRSPKTAPGASDLSNPDSPIPLAEPTSATVFKSPLIEREPPERLSTDPVLPKHSQRASRTDRLPTDIEPAIARADRPLSASSDVHGLPPIMPDNSAACSQPLPDRARIPVPKDEPGITVPTESVESYRIADDKPSAAVPGETIAAYALVSDEAPSRAAPLPLALADGGTGAYESVYRDRLAHWMALGIFVVVLWVFPGLFGVMNTLFADSSEVARAFAFLAVLLLWLPAAILAYRTTFVKLFLYRSSPGGAAAWIIRYAAWIPVAWSGHDLDGYSHMATGLRETSRDRPERKGLLLSFLKTLGGILLVSVILLLALTLALTFPFIGCSILLFFFLPLLQVLGGNRYSDEELREMNEFEDLLEEERLAKAKYDLRLMGPGRSPLRLYKGRSRKAMNKTAYRVNLLTGLRFAASGKLPSPRCPSLPQSALPPGNEIGAAPSFQKRVPILRMAAAGIFLVLCCLGYANFPNLDSSRSAITAPATPSTSPTGDLPALSAEEIDRTFEFPPPEGWIKMLVPGKTGVFGGERLRFDLTSSAFPSMTTNLIYKREVISEQEMLARLKRTISLGNAVLPGEGGFRELPKITVAGRRVHVFELRSPASKCARTYSFLVPERRLSCSFAVKADASDFDACVEGFEQCLEGLKIHLVEPPKTPVGVGSP